MLITRSPDLVCSSENPRSELPSQNHGGSIIRPMPRNAKIPTRLPDKFHEYADNGLGAKSIWRLTVWPSGINIQTISRKSTPATRAANRNCVQLQLPVAQISMSDAPPRLGTVLRGIHSEAVRE